MTNLVNYIVISDETSVKSSVFLEWYIYIYMTWVFYQTFLASSFDGAIIIACKLRTNLRIYDALYTSDMPIDVYKTCLIIYR